MELRIPEGATKNSKRLGRGPGSRTGCTAGKGTKGQKARSGKKIRTGFEGGQMPLYRRLPQRGFSNYPFKQVAEEVSLRDLDRMFQANDVVNIEKLHARKLVSKNAKFVKVLSTGEISKPVTLAEGVYTTRVARDKIIAAGGKVEAGLIANEATSETTNEQENKKVDENTSAVTSETEEDGGNN